MIKWTLPSPMIKRTLITYPSPSQSGMCLDRAWAGLAHEHPLTLGCILRFLTFPLNTMVFGMVLIIVFPSPNAVTIQSVLHHFSFGHLRLCVRACVVKRHSFYYNH